MRQNGGPLFLRSLLCIAGCCRKDGKQGFGLCLRQCEKTFSRKSFLFCGLELSVWNFTRALDLRTGQQICVQRCGRKNLSYMT